MIHRAPLRAPHDFRGEFRTDSRARAAYAEGAGIFRIVPAAVARPATPDDLVALVSWAREQSLPLIPRGAGSGMGGGNVGAGVLVDLTALADRSCQVEGLTARAHTAAGVTAHALNEAAQPAGLRLPAVPSSGRWATLGGMVACNAAGARTLRYGPVRRWVTGLSVVTGEGHREELRRGIPGPDHFERKVAPKLREVSDEIRERFPRTSKNTCGYALDAWLESGDLLDLFIGSEGTLGFITHVEWRLDPLPGATAALRVDLSRLEQLGEAVEALRGADPSAIELLDRTFLDLVARGGQAGVPGPGTEAILLVEIERPTAGAARGAVGDAVRRVGELALDVRTALDPAEVEALWAIRHGASPALAGLPATQRSLQVIEDGCVPVPRLGEYVAEVRAIARQHGVPAVLFGHAGDGHLHVNLLPDTTVPGWEAAVRGIWHGVSDAVIRLGGTPSGEHGDGRLRAPLVARLYGRKVVKCFERIKREFDPDGILNPGVKLPLEGPPTFGPLKVGAGAAALPGDIALGLRRIEREAGYATNRLTLADAAGDRHQPA